jgi:SAM-dependent methyltransferase
MSQYSSDVTLAARQRLWRVSRREPTFDLFPWVLDQAGIGLNGHADVLDLGCGNGAYERALAERHHTGMGVAVDLSAGMLAKVNDGERVRADAQAIPFAGDSFDTVLAPHMLYHVPDVEAAARECRRVLRPSGRLVAVTNGEGNVLRLAEIVEEAVGTGWRMHREVDRRFSLENGAETLRTAFESVERVDCPPSEVVVTDADVFADYVASTADPYSDQVSVPWDEVVRRAREIAATETASDHGLRLIASVGCFICR